MRIASVTLLFAAALLLSGVVAAQETEVVFFTERHKALSEYAVQVRIDRRSVPYETALHEVAAWWAAMPQYTPAATPEPARLPVYSTWYNYHQNVDAAVLLQEVAVAKHLGYESIIVDDGWQTLDSRRGSQGAARCAYRSAEPAGELPARAVKKREVLFGPTPVDSSARRLPSRGIPRSGARGEPVPAAS